VLLILAVTHWIPTFIFFGLVFIVGLYFAEKERREHR
jgi:hypothetical protein